MDRKWLTFPDSHVEMGISLCPSAGLHDWSDELGNTEWGVNRVWDRWVCVSGPACEMTLFLVTAKPKSEPDSLCCLQSPQGQNPSRFGLKCLLSLFCHSFFWQSALPLHLLSSSPFFICHFLFSEKGIPILHAGKVLSSFSWMTFPQALTLQWPVTQRTCCLYGSSFKEELFQNSKCVFLRRWIPWNYPIWLVNLWSIQLQATSPLAWTQRPTSGSRVLTQTTAAS